MASPPRRGSDAEEDDSTVLADGMLPAILFLDNGGDSVKAMYLPPRPLGSDAQHCTPRFLAVPNCVGYSSVGGDNVTGVHIQELPHYHGFVVRRPVVDGFPCHVSRQAQVWEYILQSFHTDPQGERRTQVWLTVPHGAPAEVARALKQLLTQHFHFHSVVFVSTTFLALLAGELALPAAKGKGGDDDGYGDRAATATAAATSHTRRPPQRPSDGRKRARSQAKGRDNVDGTTVTGRGGALASLTAPKGCGVVVDVGFSGTTIVPYVGFLPVLSSVVRVDIGGKTLTNRLKEHLSLTQTNLLEDGWLVNHIKEQCCSLDTEEDNAAVEPRSITYYLPTIPALYPLGCREEALSARLGTPAAARGGDADGGSSSSSSSSSSDTENEGSGRRGRDSAALAAGTVDRKVLPALRLGRERSYIPGLLFDPPDTGVHQMGVTRSILHAVFERGLLGCMPLLRGQLARRVFVFGGSSQFPGFLKRLETELKSAMPPATDASDAEDRVFALRRPYSPSGSVADGGVPAVEGEGIDAVACGAAALQPLYGAAWLLATAAGAEMKRVAECRSLSLLQGPREASISELHEALERML